MRPRKASLSKWKFCVHADKRQMLQELTSSIQTQGLASKGDILLELTGCLATAVGADAHNLYMGDAHNQQIVHYAKGGKE
jgi:cAMP and cAMP-inhibited cGMP 3',5'-cyclic phosphodiesterase 10